MSEQEFAPQSNSERDDEYTETQQSPYYWSTTPRKSGTPRDEPPSTIEEPIMPGQDYQTGYNGSTYQIPSYEEAAQQQSKIVDADPPYAQQQQQQQQQQRGFGGGWGNNPYQNQQRGQWGQWNQWNTPGWARPQYRRNRGGQIFWLVLMLIFFARPLFGLLGVLLHAAGILIGAVFSGFIMLMVFLLLATIVTRILFRTSGGVHRYRRRNNPWSRGPWW